MQCLVLLFLSRTKVIEGIVESVVVFHHGMIVKY